MRRIEESSFITFAYQTINENCLLYKKVVGLRMTRVYMGNSLSERRHKMAEEIVGKVSHFFARPLVAGIELTAPLNVGDKIQIKGHTTNLELTVGSMQINNVNVTTAKAGDSIGIKVTDHVRAGDTVYKVTE
jgi:translation initiation factor IF-2